MLCQVLKDDHVASGLCCIQLFMNSMSQEEALRHLGHAKVYLATCILFSWFLLSQCIIWKSCMTAQLTMCVDLYFGERFLSSQLI